jgi:hypothetical protein
VAVGTLAVLVGSMVVGASESTIADSFPTVGSYSGSTGAKPWNGPWVEETDDGGASTGNVRVLQASSCSGSSCLRIDHGLIGTQAIHRDADLAGAEQAILHVSLSRQGGILAAANINIKATGNGSKSVNVAINSASPTVKTLDISSVVSGDTEIRFETMGVGVGTNVYIDDVRIELVYPDPTTTTSTTTTLISIPSTTLPSLPTTTVTLLPTTTSTPSSTSTTTRPTSTTSQGSSSTTLEDSGTTTTLPTDPSATDQPPLDTPTGFDLDLARVSGVTLNLVPDAPADLGFSFGVNPVTGLTVNFLSVVEIIKAEFLSALGLGTMVAFFVIGGWKKEDEEDNEDEAEDSRS